MTNPTASRNFEAAKVAAILVVFAAHFAGDALPWMWIPASVALFVFAFSSAYFTSAKYHDRMDVGEYFRPKKRYPVLIFPDSCFLMGGAIGSGNNPCDGYQEAAWSLRPYGDHQR